MKTLFARLTLALALTFTFALTLTTALSAGEPMHTFSMGMKQPAPATAYVGLSVTSALIMWPDTAAPCVACVTGASTFTIGITSPVTSIFTNNTYKWLITYNSDGYTGPCAASLALVRGSTVLTSTTTPLTCHSLTSYVSWSSFNLPGTTDPGPALLIGQFKSADGSIISTTTTPITIQ